MKDIFALKSLIFVLAIQQCNDGDGTGGTEEHIGSTRTLDECVKFVKAIRPNANGATFDVTCADMGCRNLGCCCFAEFGMTGWNTNNQWRSCRFDL